MQRIITDKGQVTLVDDTGMHHDITPICVHCKKVDGMKKCEIKPKVVYCSGQCVVNCKDYKRPAQQLDLFSSEIIEYGNNNEYITNI